MPIRKINVQGTVIKTIKTTGQKDSSAPLAYGDVQIFRIDFRRLDDRLITRLNIPPFKGSPAALTGAALSKVRSDAIKNWPAYCQNIPQDYDALNVALPAVLINTNGSGKFSSVISLESEDEFADFSFQVKQSPLGASADNDSVILWKTACDAHFNYAEVNPVTVTVTNPNAVACAPTPANVPTASICITGIGNINIQDIADLQDPKSTDSAAGLTNGAPWGGTLAIQMAFDPALTGVKYYRWSYSSDGIRFTHVTTPVTHHYLKFSPSEPPIPTALSLGPKTIPKQDDVFEIPVLPPGCLWYSLNDQADKPFAFFDSTAGDAPNPGLVTLKLELFDKDGMHVKASADGTGPQLCLLDLQGQAKPVTNPAKNLSEGDFIFRLQLDNGPTVASILGVRTTGNQTSQATDCGILTYSQLTDEVAIQYVAMQPHDHLSWSLAVSRGRHAGSLPGGTGTKSSPPWEMPDPTPNGPGYKNAAMYTNTAKVLLDSCADKGGAAAFTVTLTCTGTATNGYGPVYSSADSISFALMKNLVPQGAAK